MTDSLPTVWAAEPHTLVKHQILRRYLQAWFPILTQQAANLRAGSREVLFIDGFAGPGEYEGGELGSPVIALKTALDHKIEFPVPVRMLFVEQRDDRFQHLQTVLKPYLRDASLSAKLRVVEPRKGDCDTVLNEVLADFDRKQVKFGPALVFLDQFGYGAVSMDLISRILSYPQCEVFTYLSYKEMNRWITDPNKAEAFTRAFGGDEWRKCIPLNETQRREQLLDRYKEALRTRAGAKYVVSFLMFDKNNQPLYWLLFCTRNLRGLEEMKKAMWFVDKNGEFRFSDRDNPDQLELLEKCFDQNWLADELRSRLNGQTVSASQVKEFVLVETPCYLFRDALRTLESRGDLTVIKAPPRRRVGDFPDRALGEILVRFEKNLF